MTTATLSRVRIAGAWEMRPLSRGCVEAGSNRPGDMPAFNPGYRSEEADRHATIGCLRFAPGMLAATALTQFVRQIAVVTGAPAPSARSCVALVIALAFATPSQSPWPYVASGGS